MASIGQVADNVNGISRLASMHPAAFSNTWVPDNRDRYMMEMQASTYQGRPTAFNRNGSTTTTTSGYQQYPSVESTSLLWRQRQALELDEGLIIPNHSIHLANSISNGSKRGTETSSVRIHAAIAARSDSMTRDSHPTLQNSSSELYDSTTRAPAMTADWHAFVDSDAARYPSLLPPMAASSSGLQQLPSGVGGANEGAMIRELIGKLGGSNSIGSSGNSLLSSSLPSRQLAGVGEGGESLAARNHCWNSGSNAMAVEMPTNVGRGLTVDPSKGGLSLNHAAVVAAGISTSHCLSPFSADPGFAERAAKFSSFSNGNYARSNSDSGGPARTRSRSGASPRSPGTSTTPLHEGLGRVACNDSTAPERHPDSSDRETHSASGASDDVVPPAAAANKDSAENSLEQNRCRDEGYTPSKTVSKASSSLLRSARTGEDEGEAPQGTSAATSTDASSRLKRPISTFTPEQGDSAGSPVEADRSPRARSGATDISVKKRKAGFEERTFNKHGASGSASSYDDKDAKTTETEDAKAKRLRRGDGLKDKDDRRAKADRSGSETSGDSSPRSTKHSTDHPKSDYIHVRARRGQATDSHSLAERVRREKISERMKFLQDLVPGCSKVTGKAVMLDEIINYVQSLQRQVEFLSMKLAFVNPRLDFHQESFMGKEGPNPGPQAMVLGSENSVAYPPLQPHPQPQRHQTQLQHGLDYQLHAENTVRRSISAMSVVPPKVPQQSQIFMPDWNDSELHSIVQMGFGEGRATPVPNPMPVSTTQHDDS